MAWRFRLASRSISGESLHLHVQFFDEADRGDVVDERFSFDVGVDKAAVVSAVRTRGREVRDRRAAARALVGQFAEGEEGVL